jgi:hypothetical protein
MAISLHRAPHFRHLVLLLDDVERSFDNAGGHPQADLHA